MECSPDFAQDSSYCREGFGECPVEDEYPCPVEGGCITNGCSRPVSIWELGQSSICGQDPYGSLANPKHAEKGSKKQLLTKSSLGQKRSSIENARLPEKKSNANKPAIEGAEAKEVWTSKESTMIEERDVAKAMPTKTQLLLSFIFAGVVVSAGLVINRQVQRSTVNTPECMLG